MLKGTISNVNFRIILKNPLAIGSFFSVEREKENSLVKSKPRLATNPQSQ